MEESDNLGQIQCGAFKEEKKILFLYNFFFSLFVIHIFLTTLRK